LVVWEKYSDPEEESEAGGGDSEELLESRWGDAEGK
jgi:hypothetical protein